MKIPNALPQFEGTTALLVVAGKQNAKLYMARDGSLQRVMEVKASKPQYTDKEGQFKRRGRGGTMSSGSVQETRDDETVRSFIAALKESLKSTGAAKGATKIYVFAPPPTRPRVVGAFGAREREKIEREFDGNYVSIPMLDLVKKIAESRGGRKVAPADAVARKILSVNDAGTSK